MMRIIALISFFCLYLPVGKATGKPDKLFSSEDILQLELRSDFTALQKNRMEEPVWFDGVLVYYQPEGTNLKIDVKVSVRGNFRLRPENCSFPPLLIDFRKESVKNTLFEDQNRLKLVTPCQDEEDLLDEYIVYRLYNQVTEYSFRVRLAKILYFDTRTNEPLFVKYSFFLEDEERMAKRNDAKVTEKFYTPFDLDYESYKKLSVFQYIIGNKDWYAVSRKNIVIVQPHDSTLKPVAVPYDFDFSGFVNASYTEPKGLPAYTMGYRRGYKGICYSEDEFLEVFDYFRKMRRIFLEVIRKEESLSPAGRYNLVDYIKYSISILRSRYVLKNEFLKNCETKELYNISAR